MIILHLWDSKMFHRCFLFFGAYIRKTIKKFEEENE